jgi:subtilisin-like proprotein convertase family protein
MGFTITVNPTPAVNVIPNQVVCQNAPTAPVNFTGTPAGAVFQWTNNTPAIGLAASGTGNIPSFIALNPTALPLVATITVTPVTGLATPIVTTYNFTGATQTFTVPAGITSVNLKTWGAQGNSNAGGIVGGLGGYAEGNLAVVPGQVLNVLVGGGAATSINGGFNGGGAAGTNPGCAAAQAGGGGGASDVRIAPYALANRVIVGAGGGGAGGNRTAGCGRGTGGGGGGGLYGGGGGAGWPGVPPGGPVPTGGTQVAGGAAGTTTWTAGGPTDGFPGILAVGGAGGNEVASAQGTPTGPAEQGGVGGGLTGGSGLYNSANNWNGHSGAGGSSFIGGVTGGITTAGLRTGAGRVDVTYTPISAATCFGAPRSFTITVNPNPSLIIVADPGTTICEGDPTLLTVYNSSGFAPVTLTQSANNSIVVGSVACNAGGLHTDNSYWRAYNLAALGLPSALTVNTVTFGIEQAAGGAQPVTVNLYTQTTGTFPGGTRTLVGSQAATVPNQTLSLFTVTFGTPVIVPNTAVLIVELFTPSGQATGRSFFIGSNAAPQTGPSYISAAACGAATPTDLASLGFPNMHIVLNVGGTVGSVGGIATGTFLWSPAAGLSSTTSNPVAASPMNTTTYTVVRTTGAGCQASAQVTITVNKRPTVTVQPVSIARCSGTTATFTVGGTGTALTYQWQVSTTGCAGPWVNVPTVAPYAGGTTPTLTITPVSGTMNGYVYRCVLGGPCAPILTNNISNCVTLTVNPLPNIAVTPPVSCGGVAGISGTALTVTAFPPPVPGNVSVNSGAINVPIPDGTNVAATSNLTVAGIPANATITEVRVNMNINHTWVGDVDVNLRAPNLAILNLVAGLDNGAGGNATDNFTNTSFSSLGGLTISGAAAPRTATYTAEARAGRGPIGFIQTVTTWGGLYPTATVANGVWTIAMGDRVLTDVGTLTNWSISIDYTTPGTGPVPVMSYAWAPLTGLYTLPNGTGAYTGTNLSTVYAAPTVQTTYTVTATDVATGCTSTASALVNYTPPAPTITPSSVTMCLGDPAVRLVASSSTAFTTSATTGTISIPIPDNVATATTSNLTISGIPAGATITSMTVALNMPHTYPADMVFNLRAPNGQILSLYKHNTNTDNGPASVATAGFYNAVVSSAATTAFVAVPTPFRYGITAPAGPYKADALNGVTNPGYPIMDPTGFVSNAANFGSLYSTPNGTYTLAMCDGGPGDLGTLQGWTLTVNYLVGVLSTPAVWSPAAGLFTDPSALPAFAYVAGTPRDTVWTRPTPSGVYTYTATVNNLINFTATPATPMAGGNGNNLVTFNIKNNNAFPVTLAGISTNAFGSGAVAVRAFYKTTGNAGNPGPIDPANGFIQFGTSNVTVTAGALNPVLTGLTLSIPAGATYALAIDFTGATFPAYTNGAATTVTYSNNGCDIITGGNVGWGGPNAPAAPVNNPRNFNGTVTFLVSGPGTCQSPPRTVVVTVNQPTTLNANIPADQTVCTDKVATFSVAVATGTGPHSYRWEVSTNNGNPPWAPVNNGGVYSGATTSTLTITAPPVSMSGYQYRAIVTGAAPCASVISRNAILTVNPLPVIVISAAPYTSLFPGLRTTLSSTVSPVPAAAGGYSWLRNGSVLASPALGVVSGIGTGSLLLDVDGMGDYQLRVTDVNGCTNISNTITIKDSASGKCFIYPNPNSGQFQVRYYSVANNVLPRGLVIYDAKGDRVKVLNYTIGRPYDRMDVDMRANGKGLYWVEIVDRNGNRLTMCRVVIQ